MSVKVMAQVWALDLPQNLKFVLLAFADHADDEGLCFPSISRVAWKTGYSERSIQSIVRKLDEELHLLKPVQHKKGGRGLAVVYRIQPEKGEKSAPFFTGKGCSAQQKRVKSKPLKGEVAAAPQSSVTTNNHQKKGSGSSEPSHFAFSGRHLKITEAQDQLLAEAFPSVDRAAEYRKMDSWLEANAERRPKKQSRFAQNWFSRIEPRRNGTRSSGAVAPPAGKYSSLKSTVV